MNMKNLFNRTLALVCAVLMMISLFALPAFADDHAGHDHDHAEETTTTTGNDNTALIVWIIVGGVLVVAGVVLGIKYREKIVKALRVYKSEFKKVSWLSWKDTKKSSLVVLGVLVVCAVVICLLDLGLSEGLLAMVRALRDLFA
jgi:preprotein translocase SecE subunit